VWICFLHIPGNAASVEMLKVMADYLEPGGVLVFEGYHEDQLSYKTGGPPFEDWLFTSALVRQSLDGL